MRELSQSLRHFFGVREVRRVRSARDMKQLRVWERGLVIRTDAWMREPIQPAGNDERGLGDFVQTRANIKFAQHVESLVHRLWLHRWACMTEPFNRCSQRAGRFATGDIEFEKALHCFARGGGKTID